jgi:hypothetical protein
MHLNRNKISVRPRLTLRAKKSTGGGKGVSPRPAKNTVKNPAESTQKIKSQIKKKNRARFLKTKGYADYQGIAKEYEDYRLIRECKDILNGHPAFLLGNGPSISKKDLTLLNNFFTIGINRIFYIYEPTVLFWQDRELWRSSEHDIINCRAVKVCRNVGDPRYLFNHFRLGEDPFRFSGKPHKLYGRGNTGALTAQFAYGLGCSSLVILGMDCKYDESGKTDFYGINDHHKPYTLKMCNTAMRWLKKNSPLPIYNCSENKIWPQMELEEVIEEINPEPLGKKHFRKLFLK